MFKGIHNSHGRVSLEYLELVDPESLHSLTEANAVTGAILVGAILVGAIRLRGSNGFIRLIDNVILV